ncbi:MAG: hypothetical protein J6M66_03120 [Lachnospiraceae bacterium]|nr:hypothetical protein [Lachnospiraceae bacterium]
MKITGSRNYIKFDFENGYVAKAEGGTELKEKFIKTGLVLFCILMIGLFCFGYQDINYDPDFTYEKLDDGTLRLNKYNGDDLIVKIPEKVRGRKVTQIGKECFYKKNVLL